MSRSLGSVLHTEGYQRRVLFDANSFVLASTQYKEYPIQVYEGRDCHIVVEGHVDGREPNALRHDLEKLAERVFSSKELLDRPIKDWLLGNGGDFVIVFIQKKANKICLFNDSLGRLPLYYARANDEIIISRELRLVAKLRSGTRFDRMAIAQYLIWGYPLGKRTLLENIYRLPPGTILRVQIDPPELRLETIPAFNFQEKKHSHESVQDNARVLVSLFSEACRYCTGQSKKTVLGLSGGLDSRSVGAGLAKNDIPFSAVTFDIDKRFAMDAKLAEQLAQAFNTDWQMFELDSPRGKDFARLLRLKGGLNDLGMSFILPFFERVEAAYGPGITYLTGDGGDKVLPDLRPKKPLRTLHDLVAYTIAETVGFSLKRVSCLTRLPQSDIVEEIRACLSTYPEQSLVHKYVHFLIYERGFKWLFEGEDRNRSFFWSASPFYSLEFFRYAMECPDEQKAHYGLYRQFLLQLSPIASQIDNSHWRLPISSKMYLMKVLWTSMIHQMLSPPLRKKIKSVMSPYRPSVGYERCFQQQVNVCEALDDYLCREALKTFPQSCTKTEMANLMTIVSCIEEIEDGRSTLEQYHHAPLT